jgi:hypothetical protein
VIAVSAVLAGCGRDATVLGVVEPAPQPNGVVPVIRSHPGVTGVIAETYGCIAD